MLRPRLALLALLPFWVACPDKKADPQAVHPATAQKADKVPAAVVLDKSSDPDCISAWAPDGNIEKIAGARTFDKVGTRLIETSADPDDKAVFGVVANMKEDTPENLENLKKTLAFFKENQVDAIIMDGDLGETESQITNALSPLGETGLPVFVIIGNREKKSDFNNAVNAVAAKYPGVINLNQVRLVMLDDVALVSLPGYHDKAYLHAVDGCQYLPSDVEATKPIIAAAGAKTVVLISHGPPKQEGTESLDRTLEQANVGDAALAGLLRDTNVKFGVFANIQEAGGRATDLSGTKLYSPDKPSPELFLNPGAIDAVSWKMNDSTRSVGMAAILTVQGKEASYKTFKIPGGDD